MTPKLNCWAPRGWVAALAVLATLALVALAPAAAVAQPLDDPLGGIPDGDDEPEMGLPDAKAVFWSARFERTTVTAGDRVMLELTALVPDGLHTYEIDNEAEGGSSSVVKVQVPGVTLDGVWEQPESQPDDAGDMRIEAGALVFRCECQVDPMADAGVHRGTVVVYYNACNERGCDDATLELPVGLTIKPGEAASSVVSKDFVGDPEEGPHSTWSFFVDPPTVSPGQTAYLRVRVKTHGHYHAYPFTYPDDAMPPKFQVELDEAAGITVAGEWREQHAKLVEVPRVGEEGSDMLITDGMFLLPIHVDANAELGARTIKVKFEGAVCDDRGCFFPGKDIMTGEFEVFSVPVTIAPDAAPAESVYKDERLRVQLHLEHSTVAPGTTSWLAVSFSMSPTWHIYWRNPLTAGLPPTIALELPEGVTAGDIQWPVPFPIVPHGAAVKDGEKPAFSGLGYTGQATLLVPIAIDPSFGGDSLRIGVKPTWQTCSAEQCIQGNADLALDVPVAAEAVSNEDSAGILETATANLPLLSSETAWAFRAAVVDGYLVIEAVRPKEAKTAIKQLGFMPDAADVFDTNKEQVTVQSKSGVQVKVPLLADAEVPTTITGLIGAQGVNFAPEGARAASFIDVSITPGPADQLSAPVTPVSGNTTSTDNMTIWAALGMALLGGFILNLMPCVLPVLSIKVLGFVESAHSTHVKPIVHSLAFSAGVIASFWALAILTIALKAAGAVAGWGFQLANPIVLYCITAFMFLFALNLFGLFEVGTSLIGVGGGKKKGGLTGSFVTGVTATIVATPCTAPFMAPALGYTLIQPWWVSILVFTCLGVGMSAPYVVLSASPKLMSKIPKPGPWMVSLKQFMGFLLMATCVYLVYIYAGYVTRFGLMMGLFGLVLVAVAAWVYGRWNTPIKPVKTRRISLGWTTLFLVGGMTMGLWYAKFTEGDTGNATAGEIVEGEMPWDTYTPEKLAEYREQGIPVLIDYTADW